MKAVKQTDLCHSGDKKIASKERNNLGRPTQTPQGEINNKNVFTLSYILYLHKSKESSNVGLVC